MNTLEISAINAKKVFESSFDIAMHIRMRDDKIRTCMYETAIRQKAPGKVVLDIGTGPFALLALLCAEAGAKHIYAVEVCSEAAILARETVKKSGYSNVTIIEGFSTLIDLPEKVELVVHEIIGNIASEEGVILALTDASIRHLRHPIISIPNRVCSLLAPVQRFWMQNSEGRSVTPGDCKATKTTVDSFPPDLLLSEPQIWEDFCFMNSLALTSNGIVHCIAKRDGILSGLMVYVHVWLGEDLHIDTSIHKTTWRPVLLMLGAESAVHIGDDIAIKYSTDLRGFPCKYNFEVVLNLGTLQEQYVSSYSVEMKGLKRLMP